jgi:uncharacterized cupin superfamily protein
VRRVNVFTAELKYDEADPEGYRAAVARLAGELGSVETSLNLFEIPAGEDLCPYHYEYVEEWLLVLDGNAVVRGPEGEEEVGRGDLVWFPPGPDGAHKVMNRSQEPVRLIMFSSSREPSVAVYPDSAKVGVWTPNQEDKWMFRRGDGNVDYYDGER